MASRSIGLFEQQAVGRNWNGSLISAIAHTFALTVLLGMFHSAPKLVPYKWPGTAKGVRLLTYYSPGSAQPASSDLKEKTPAPVQAKSTVHTPTARPTPTTPSASVERGIGNAALSGQGDGDMRMAYQKVFPYPRPDLSTLPAGRSGDVVLSAVIDEHGNIQDLKLLSGLGPAIDDTVLATVRQWTFTPATRNGTPIPSEQEFHFHYARA